MSEHGTHAEENAVARAREDFARGEYRWVAQVMTHVLFTELENRDARAACRRLRNSGTSRNPPPTRISSARRSCGCPPELLSCYDHASERRRGRTQMRLKTALCERLGIELPIIQAPMGGAVGPSLAAAVSNAGALGMLVPWRADLEAVRQQIRQTRALTSRPFGVNLNLEFPQEDRLAVCLEERVPVVSFFWRDPSSLVPRAKAGGAMVLHTVGSAADARHAVSSGVDVIVAQGWEAGGHVRGTVATMALVPAVVDAVSPVPVVAAGGIADGRGLAAVLALGAAGAWIGTRFLASVEAAIHARYRERLLHANENDTVFLENLFDVRWPNAPHRVLKNETVHTWEAAGRPPSGQRPGEGEVIGRSRSIGPIVRYQSYTPGPDTEGDVDAMSLWAGQSVGLVSTVQPAGDIVREIADRAKSIIQRLAE